MSVSFTRSCIVQGDARSRYPVRICRDHPAFARWQIRRRRQPPFADFSGTASRRRLNSSVLSITCRFPASPGRPPAPLPPAPATARLQRQFAADHLPRHLFHQLHKSSRCLRSIWARKSFTLPVRLPAAAPPQQTVCALPAARRTAFGVALASPLGKTLLMTFAKPCS